MTSYFQDGGHDVVSRKSLKDTPGSVPVTLAHCVPVTYWLAVYVAQFLIVISICFNCDVLFSEVCGSTNFTSADNPRPQASGLRTVRVRNCNGDSDPRTVRIHKQGRITVTLYPIDSA